MNNSRPNARLVSPVDFCLGLLAVLSLGALFIPESWITRDHSLPLDSLQGSAYSDSVMGGASEAELLEDKQHSWTCRLRPGVSDPFCSFQLSLVGENGSGLDLSQYRHMTVDLEYQGDASGVRIYLRNRHPRYYKLGDLSSTKYNLVEIPTSSLNEPYRFRLNSFSVADWWLSQKNIPLELAGPDFNDVLFMEVQTGSDVDSGEHTFVLKSVSWSGPIISRENLYRGVLLVWILAILFMLLYRVIRLKVKLRRTREYQSQLAELNKLLNVQNEQVEELAKTDPLTGLANRLGIREPLREGFNLWQKNYKPFSVILIDLDNFKSINDQHGHDVGDKVLKTVAEIFSTSVRKSDVVARWGGEEFMIVCPSTNIDQASVVAENLRARLANTVVASGLHVTASFGVASLTRGSNLEEVFKAADKALYSAKTNGRNRVVSAGSEPQALKAS